MTSRPSGIHCETNPQHLQNPVLAFLKTYWDRKKASRTLPCRADIKPVELKEHLGWIILLDALPDYVDFRYRMIGSRVTQYFLANSTGKTLSEAFGSYGEAAVNGTLSLHRKAAKDKVVVRAYGGAGWLGRSFLDFDALLLPLSDDGETVNMVLSGFTFDLSRLLQSRWAPPHSGS